MATQTTKTETDIKLTGISAAPGICIGKAYRVDREGVEVVEKYSIDPKNIQREVRRFKQAVKKAKDELHVIIKNIPAELRQQAYILETHVAMLRDKMLYGQAIDTIKAEQVNAEWALKKISSDLMAAFQEIEDDYLRERSADVYHVSDRILRNLVGVEDVNIAEIDKRVILVAHDLSPADTSQINLERVKGFVTDRGGKASHTGIIARTLEIPAVLGLDKATRLIKNDDILIVDGTAGIVITNPSDQTLIEFEERQGRYEAHRAVISRGSHLSAETTDGRLFKVQGNIELPEEVFAVINYGGDGVGLYRTEFQYLSRPEFPEEDELFDKYKDVVEVMAPKPVTIRTLDINGDKAIRGAAGEVEANPALGQRAIRYCLHKPDVFLTQLRAILRAAAFGNVRILFPMISSYDEICDALKYLDQAAASLEKEGVDYNRDIEIGIMIEVPSAVVMADVMAKSVDFFSIGTNDLVQYALAIDRGNRHVAHLYNSLHPAHIRMVRYVADVARDKGINIFMCGEMAGDPLHVPILLGMEMDELSMNPQSIPAVKTMIRSLSVSDCKLFLKEALRQSRVSDIEKMVQDTYGSLFSEQIYTE